MEVISKADAIKLGLTHYFTGVPCKNGGVSPRSVKGSKCACSGCKAVKAKTNRKHYDENRESYIERARNHYLSDTDKVKAYKAEWASKNSERLKLAKQKYYVDNKQKINDACAMRRKLNPERCREEEQAKYQKNRDTILKRNKDYRVKNKDRIRFVNRAHYKANRHKYYESARKRTAAHLQATPAWYGEFDEFVIKEAFELCDSRGEATGIVWHVDHMIPLQAVEACGLHCAANVQVIPAFINCGKRHRMELTEPLEWLSAIAA